MSREALSQAEIDALLKSMAEEPHVTSVLSDDDKNALTEFGNILFGGSATALTTLLANEVQISIAKVAATTKRTLADEVPGRSLVAEFHVTSTFSGTMYLVAEESAIATAGALMTGSTEAVTELAESQMPIVTEVLSQFSDGGSSALSGLVDNRSSIQIAGVGLRDLGVDDLSSQFLPDDMLVKLIFRWQIGSLVDSQLILVMPQALANSIVSALMGSPAPTPVLPDAGSGVPVVAVTSPAAAAALAAPPGGGAGRQAPAAAQTSRAAGGRQPVMPESRVTVQPAEFSDLPRRQAPEAGGNIDLLLDVPLVLTVELGRTKKTIREILSLGPGSVVELEKLAGETVDILVGGKLIAKGEVVVIDENFAVRITDIVSPVDRLNSLR